MTLLEYTIFRLKKPIITPLVQSKDYIVYKLDYIVPVFDLIIFLKKTKNKTKQKQTTLLNVTKLLMKFDQYVTIFKKKHTTKTIA